MVLFDDAHKSIDRAQRRPQIVRDRIGKTLQLVIDLRQRFRLLSQFIIGNGQSPVPVPECLLRPLPL